MTKAEMKAEAPKSPRKATLVPVPKEVAYPVRKERPYEEARKDGKKT
jgi:hypothetical protein